MGQFKQLEELREAAKPLVDYLYKYGTPHDTIIVTQATTEFLQGIGGVSNELRD